MATYSAASSIALANGAVTVNSSSGTITANQTIFTAPAGRKTILEIKGVVAIALSASGDIGFKLEKQSSYNSTWASCVAWDMTITTAAINVMTSLVLDAANRKILIDSGRVDGSTVGDATSSGNVRIVMYPGDRIRTTGGTTGNGANYKLEYVTEQYFAA